MKTTEMNSDSAIEQKRPTEQKCAIVQKRPAEQKCAIVQKRPAELNSDSAIEQAVTVLRNGGLLLYPTDTVWGLGCDATNSEAVNKIIQLKGRSQSQSFIVLVLGVEQIERYIEQMPEIAYSLIEVSDTPLTIIYPGARSTAQHPDGFAPKIIAQDGFAPQVAAQDGSVASEAVTSKTIAARTVLQVGFAPQVIAQDGSVAIRVVRHPFCIAMLQRFRKPIVSTSANFTGSPSPTSFAAIDPKLIRMIDYCVDPAFEDPATGKPSSIIKVEVNGEVKIIRP